MYNKLKFVLPLMLLVIILSACGEKEYEGKFSYDIQDFTFTDQNGNEFSKSELDGKFWVAGFIFTNCETVCPPMTSNMARLQNQLQEAGLEDVHLVSFTVDPKRDTPETLKEFAKSRGAQLDLGNWHLLTGYEFQTIKELSIKSFKSALEEPAEGEDQFLHTIRFFLVSPEGNAILSYDGRKPGDMKKIVEDIKSFQ